MYSLGPLHRVAMTGLAMAIASTCGLPQPSPLLGSTKASAAAYTAGSSVEGIPLLRRRTVAVSPSPRSSALRLRAMNARICASKSASEW